MQCVPAPALPLSRGQVAARLIHLAQDAEAAGHVDVAVGLVELAYAVLDGAGRR